MLIWLLPTSHRQCFGNDTHSMPRTRPASWPCTARWLFKVPEHRYKGARQKMNASLEDSRYSVEDLATSRAFAWCSPYNAMLLRIAEAPSERRKPRQHCAGGASGPAPCWQGVDWEQAAGPLRAPAKPEAQCSCSVCLMREVMLLQVAEKEAQRKELAQRCEALEVRLAPLEADKAELGGRLQGLEKRAKEAEKACTDFEWRSRCALCPSKPCILPYTSLS